eukprot:1276384-Pleurochrysis_carterae.AAC.1
MLIRAEESRWARRTCGGEHVFRLEELRDAKVAELEVTGACDEDVLALEVAVQHAALVHVLKRQRDLHEPEQHLRTQRRAGPRAYITASESASLLRSLFLSPASCS